jgi:hypothetical protein
MSNAVDKLKELLSKPRSLSPRPIEHLLLYIAATMQVVIATLVVE